MNRKGLLTRHPLAHTADPYELWLDDVYADVTANYPGAVVDLRPYSCGVSIYVDDVWIEDRDVFEPPADPRGI